jgi:hypothetical protein
MKGDEEFIMQSWALGYAERGTPVFPCKPGGKKPLTRHGFKDATTDPKQVREWWTRWPDANIGVPTGATTGLLVVDIDPRNGGEDSWSALRAGNTIPKTAKQNTGGGGRHIIFRHPGGKVPKALAPGIDLKCDGGYIIVEPSVHASGKRYRWKGDVGPPPYWISPLTYQRGSSNSLRRRQVMNVSILPQMGRSWDGVNVMKVLLHSPGP